MNGLALTSRGLEDTAAYEIRELINADCKTEDYTVLFDFKKFEDLCLLCYKCQSVDKILLLLGVFESSNILDELGKFIDKLELGDWLKSHRKFKIECVRLGIHDFNSTDVKAKACNFILEKFKNNKVKLDLKDYDIIFLICIIDKKCYFGVDFAGIDLNKRSYKIFLHSGSLRGTVAYALIRECNFQKEDVMLDPFSRDGILPIEAALYASGFPVNYYNKEKFAFLKLKIGIDFEKFFHKIDKQIRKKSLSIFSYDHLFKFVDYSRKNAKIAGVDKNINFSRVELEWLDIKFKKESVDCIITSLPTSKNANLDKIYNEFFYQSEYILKPDGRLALISKQTGLVIKHANKHNFVIAKEREIWSGEQPLKILLFEKKTI